MPDEFAQRCVACKSTLPAGADVCTECGSYQAGWKNLLKFWANVSAVVVVAITAVGFFTSLLPEIRRTVLPKRSVALAYLDTQKFAVLANRSDQAVFVAYMEFGAFEAKGESASFSRLRHKTVNAVIQPGAFHVVDFADAGAEDEKAMGDPIGQIDGDLLVEEASTALGAPDCYAVTYHDAVALEELRRISSNRISSLRAFGLIAFRPADGDEMLKQSVSAQLVVWRTISVECERKYRAIREKQPLVDRRPGRG